MKLCTGSVLDSNDWYLEKGGATKKGKFSEKFKTAFDPPHFRKIM